MVEKFGWLEEGIATFNEYGEIQSLGFAEERLPVGTMLFRAKADAYFGLFCNDEFRNKVEEAGLVGIFGGGRGADH